MTALCRALEAPRRIDLGWHALRNDGQGYAIRRSSYAPRPSFLRACHPRGVPLTPRTAAAPGATGATSCTRMICTPCIGQRQGHADRAGRAVRLLSPSTWPMNPLREWPTTTGQPSSWNRPQSRKQRQVVLVQSCRSRCPGRARCAIARCRQPAMRRAARADNRTRPRPRRHTAGCRCIVCGVPGMCMAIRPTPRGRGRRRASADQLVSAVTSLTISAPASTHARATAAFDVSMETGTRGPPAQRGDHAARRGGVLPPRARAWNRAACSRRRRRADRRPRPPVAGHARSPPTRRSSGRRRRSCRA